MPLVRCTTCFREELWSDVGAFVDLRVEGGARTAPDHIQQARVRAFRAGPVVGDCAGCGSLLEGPESLAWTSLLVPTPEGDLVLTIDGAVGPTGNLSLEEEVALLERHFGPPAGPGLGATVMGGGFMVGLATTLFVLWLLACGFVSLFLSQVWQSPYEF